MYVKLIPTDIIRDYLNNPGYSKYNDEAPKEADEIISDLKEIINKYFDDSCHNSDDYDDSDDNNCEDNDNSYDYDNIDNKYKSNNDNNDSDDSDDDYYNEYVPVILIKKYLDEPGLEWCYDHRNECEYFCTKDEKMVIRDLKVIINKKYKCDYCANNIDNSSKKNFIECYQCSELFCSNECMLNKKKIAHGEDKYKRNKYFNGFRCYDCGTKYNIVDCYHNSGFGLSMFEAEIKCTSCCTEDHTDHGPPSPW